MKRSRISVGAAGLLFAVASVGCGSKQDTSPPASVASAPAPATAPAPVTKTEAPPPAATPAVASADGDLPGIRAEVQELKLTSGGTLTLKFTLVNNSGKGMGFGYTFGDSGHSIKDHGSVGGVNLLDPVGKKKYFVARDAEQNCLCSRNLNNLDENARLTYWAKFPAPPDDVKKITVEIPHFAPMEDVPISR